MMDMESYAYPHIFTVLNWYFDKKYSESRINFLWSYPQWNEDMKERKLFTCNPRNEKGNTRVTDMKGKYTYGPVIRLPNR